MKKLRCISAHFNAGKRRHVTTSCDSSPNSRFPLTPSEVKPTSRPRGTCGEVAATRAPTARARSEARTDGACQVPRNGVDRRRPRALDHRRTRHPTCMASRRALEVCCRAEPTRSESRPRLAPPRTRKKRARSRAARRPSCWAPAPMAALQVPVHVLV